ncbi:MAG: AAA family ATPase [Planctomycetaceae bacterium]|nr:AAA family ATPase [Planctomycetaceae bacterium]
MARAPDVLVARAAVVAGPERPAVIGLCGPVGSGKSHLAGLLAQRFSAVRLSTDDYLPDYHATPEHLRDEPDRADLPRLLANLTDLRQGRPTVAPVWCFHAHARVGERAVQPPPPEAAPRLVVVEGIHALHASLRGVLDVKVVLTAPASVRWARWEHLEATGQRGWGVAVAHAFFHAVAEPVFSRHAHGPGGYLAVADVVVDNSDFVPPPSGVSQG